jgi:hypothetical protein
VVVSIGSDHDFKRSLFLCSPDNAFGQPIDGCAVHAMACSTVCRFGGKGLPVCVPQGLKKQTVPYKTVAYIVGTDIALFLCKRTVDAF